MNSPFLNKRAAYGKNLTLVNNTNPFTECIDPELLMHVGPESDGVLMERHAATLLNRLMNDIGAWTQIAAVSGWRSEEEQQKIWDDSIRANGNAYTKQFVALPRHSEHHTGLAIDLGLRHETLDIVCPKFPYTGICQTFRNKASQYGFIQRYPAGKEHITGISHEPWHFRYVGIPHAEIITMLSITLEEYLEILQRHAIDYKPFRFRSAQYEFKISYVSPEQSLLYLPERTMSGIISSDNRGGYILTTWKNREA